MMGADLLLSALMALRARPDEVRDAMRMAGYSAEFGDLGDPLDIARDPEAVDELVSDAQAALASGDVKEAERYSRLALLLAANAGGPSFASLRARANILLSESLRLQDDTPQALLAVHRAQRAAIAVGDSDLIGLAQHKLGVTFHKLQNDDAARRCYRNARDLYSRDRRASLQLARDEVAATLTAGEAHDAALRARDCLALAERAADPRTYVDFAELYGRAQATAAAARPTRLELLAVREFIEGHIGSLIRAPHTTVMEQVKLEVIVFKARALLGVEDAAWEACGEIVDRVQKSQLWMELNCIKNIGKEVLDFREDDRWLRRAPAISALARSGRSLLN